MSEAHRQAIGRLDYRPPQYRVDMVELEFDLEPERTLVRARLQMRRDAETTGEPPLRLAGEDLELVSIRLDGRELGPGDYAVDGSGLTLPAPPAAFVLETEVALKPAGNTRLEGLYLSGGVLCTQCEAEGFRRITYFLDRPDVMASYRTTLRADAARWPVLLSNGNLEAEGIAPDGRRFAVWHDPFPKPCYLFALVAGDLARVEDRFVTASGREVALRIFVEHGKEDRCGYAMDALKRAMRWDEERYGLEYDLDLFNIVAVSSFNMGAMENKSLNIFNDKYILASPDTATDTDYANIEAIVAHEYFHNWTGNRVTCRDWFQLSLKEGLTVFRDQEFSADMRSAPVQRIKDVRQLRARQFPEDAGPLAHPVRPDSYIEINNFYTSTVYEKGAEVIRMLQTLLGRDTFRAGSDLYFARHDGSAATCDDFVTAMADAGGVDLSGFMRWYSQAGTPEVAVDSRYDPNTRSLELTVTQNCPPTPGQAEKQPMVIPLALGMLDSAGRDLPLRLEGEGPERAYPGRVLTLEQPTQSFRFVDVPEPPVLSLNRGFSAPVKVNGPGGDGERAFLMAHDSDPFNRWDAGQQYATGLLLRMVEAIRAGDDPEPDPAFADALGRTLADPTLDAAFVAQALALPTETWIAEQMPVIDVDAVHAARERLRREVAERLRRPLLDAYRANSANAPWSPDAEAAGRRALKNAALALLAALPGQETRDLLMRQYRDADNMTDRMGALGPLSDMDVPERAEALEDFHDRYRDDPLVIDKWLVLQATSSLPGTLEQVERLMRHPAFSLQVPNKVRSLLGAFAGANPTRFHAADGSGYGFIVDRVLELDRLNPQVAAHLLQPLGRWRRFDPGRQRLMWNELDRVLHHPGLSADVYEIASKSLA